MKADFARTFTASLVIFVTTADDALWLIPFVTSSRYSRARRIQHALVFVGALQFVVGLSVALSVVFKASTSHQLDEALPLVGAISSWIIALYLFARSMFKKWRKQQKQNYNQLNSHDCEILESGISILENHKDSLSSTTPLLRKNCHQHDNIETPTLQTPSPTLQPQEDAPDAGCCTVFSLAFIGSLDELTYFPTLLIGGTFTALDLSLGAILATTAILFVIASVLTQFKPILDCMDQIPLYAIVALFAAFLTIEALLDNEPKENIVFRKNISI